MAYLPSPQVLRGRGAGGEGHQFVHPAPASTSAKNLTARPRAIDSIYREIVLSNPKVDKTAGFFHLVDRMYLTHTLIAIRTFDDDDRRSESLLNLIYEIEHNVEYLTKDWFVERYKNPVLRKRVAVAHFRNWGGRQYISKRVVKADYFALLKLCKRVRVAVNKNVAHNSRRKPIKPLTYGEVDKAIDGIHKMMSRYSGLILNKEHETPMILSSYPIFKMAWA